jgi:ribose 5-phosphate isomerase A
MKSFRALLLTGSAAAVAVSVPRARAHSAHSQDFRKRQAGYVSVDNYVKSNMTIGLGSGSTAYFALERVDQKLRKGELLNVRIVPTSEVVKKKLLAYGIPMAEMNDITKSPKGVLDLVIGGADEIDPNFVVVNGGHGTSLREKIIESSADKVVFVVDESKLTSSLGTTKTTI